MAIEKFQMGPGVVCGGLSDAASVYEHHPDVQARIRHVIETVFGGELEFSRGLVTAAEADLDEHGNFRSEEAAAKFATYLMADKGLTQTAVHPATYRGCQPVRGHPRFWTKVRHYKLEKANGEPLLVGELPAKLDGKVLEIPDFARIEIGALCIGLQVSWLETPDAAQDESRAQPSA